MSDVSMSNLPDGSSAAGATEDHDLAPSGGADSLSQIPGESAFERAYRAAEARRGSASESASDAAAAEQAGAGAAGSDSTPAESAAAGGPGDVATGATSGEAPTAPPVSTATAPTNWPSERRDAFQALPQAAQSLVLDFHRDMQAGFTRATQEVAQIRQQADEYARLQREAQADPESFARALLQAMNLDPRTLAADEPPEFATPQDLAKWAANQAEQAAERRARAMHQEVEQRALAERARASIEGELAELAKIPGFDTLRDAALQAVAAAGGALTVTQAFNLQRLPALLDGQRELAALRSEVAALKKAEENRKKALTVPVQSSALPGVDPRFQHAPQSPAEIAYEKARAKLARQAA